MSTSPSPRSTTIQPAPKAQDDNGIYEAIRLRAFELYLQRVQTSQPGDEAGDWIEAERQVRAQNPPRQGGAFRSNF